MVIRKCDRFSLVSLSSGYIYLLTIIYVYEVGKDVQETMLNMFFFYYLRKTTAMNDTLFYCLIFLPSYYEYGNVCFIITSE